MTIDYTHIFAILYEATPPLP